MIYLTVAHCVRHGSPTSSSDLSTVYTIVSGVMLQGHLQHFEEEDLFGIKSFNLKSHAPGHLRLSSFMDQLQLFRAFTPLLGSSGGPSQFMSTHVLYYESVSINDRYVSSSLSCIVSHRTARLSEKVYSLSLMIKYHPHLVMVFFQSQPGQEKEFKHSVTEFTVKPSFFIEALIPSPHLDGLDQQASASATMQISSPLNVNAQPAPSRMAKPAVINIRWSASPSVSATVELSSQELTIMLIPWDSRQFKCSRNHQALISLNVVKNGSESSASEQLIIVFIVKWGQSSHKWDQLSAISRERVKDQEITPWPHMAQVKRCSVSEGPAHSELRSLSYRHCIISKNSDFTHHLIWVSSFHSLSGIWVLLSCHCHRQDSFRYLTKVSTGNTFPRKDQRIPQHCCQYWC